MKNPYELITIIILIAVTTSCAPVEETEEPRVDTVDKLLSGTQINDYVIKYGEEIGVDKAIAQIDLLIGEGNKDYIPETGERTKEETATEYEFNKSNNQYYIEVDIKYVVTFTHSEFTGITYVVKHRPVEYDIGKIFILLDVDYNEDGYLLKGRKITEEMEG